MPFVSDWGICVCVIIVGFQKNRQLCHIERNRIARVIGRRIYITVYSAERTRGFFGSDKFSRKFRQLFGDNLDSIGPYSFVVQDNKSTQSALQCTTKYVFICYTR